MHAYIHARTLADGRAALRKPVGAGVGVWAGCEEEGGDKTKKQKKKGRSGTRPLSHSLDLTVLFVIIFAHSGFDRPPQKSLLKPGEHHVISRYFVGDCKQELGGSRWPRVDGKPHTAMTFAGTIVGRQPSWGCLGGGAPGPSAQRAGGREASKFGALP